jgi:hypothetical protein
VSEVGWCEEMTENKLCPYDKKPCIRNECMAWSGKQDLEELKRNHADSFESLVQVMMMQEGISRSSVLDVIEIRNNNERCKLIEPEQPI